MSITQITERETALTNMLRTTTEALTLVTKERDALKGDLELARMKTYCVSISEIALERDALKADAKRYRWLFGARTAEECANEDVGLKPPLTQDFVLADLSGFYSHKELVDDMIDTVMKGKS